MPSRARPQHGLHIYIAIIIATEEYPKFFKALKSKISPQDLIFKIFPERHINIKIISTSENTYNGFMYQKFQNYNINNNPEIVQNHIRNIRRPQNSGSTET